MGLGFRSRKSTLWGLGLVRDNPLSLGWEGSILWEGLGSRAEARVGRDGHRARVTLEEVEAAQGSLYRVVRVYWGSGRNRYVGERVTI